jgi:hypothetical protein
MVINKNKVISLIYEYLNTASDDEIKEGFNWYPIAHNIVNNMSIQYNIDVFKCSGVLSALSPNNKWDQNIKDCHNVLQAFKDKVHYTNIKVCTYHTNKIKAFNIVSGDHQIKYKGSFKTYSFCQNIAYLNPDYITLDVWIIRALLNKTNHAFTIKQYETLHKCFKIVSKETGLKCYEIQAIVWVTFRNKFINKKNVNFD